MALIALAAVCACVSDPQLHPELADADADAGKLAVERYGCGSCHIVPGVRTARGRSGPPLTQFGRRSFIAGALPNTPLNLISWIRDPQQVEPGTVMPNVGVTPTDARNIAAYLLTLE